MTPLFKQPLFALLCCCLLCTTCGSTITGSYEGQGTGVRSMFGTAKLELQPSGRYYATIMGQTQAGTYAQEDGRLLFTFGNGATSVGTWSGDTLLLDGIAFLKKD